jgi:hypothetical protein
MEFKEHIVANQDRGTKRQCPKCGERFYDLNKPFPLTCIECGHTFEPEMLLKSKQPLPEDDAVKARKVVKAKAADDDVADDLLDEDLDLDAEDDDSILADDIDDIDDDDDVDVLADRPDKE